MGSLTFRRFFEATDIFGFDADRAKEEPDDNILGKPIKQFNIELMMDLLSKKSIGHHRPILPFMNEIRWGEQPGAVKLEIDTGYTFYVKKLGVDKQGNNRWVAKKLFQLNRTGYGGLEDVVAHEIHDHLKNVYQQKLESPLPFYDDLDNLVAAINNKVKKTMKDIFIPEGMKKLSDQAYVIKFGVRGQGLESPGQARVEQNQLLISFDPVCGTIRINNYNIESPVGGPHEWAIQPSDFDVTVFPSQTREEISELCAVHFKYY